ncbi:MAG: RNA polymerase sigma factor [Anaerolineae bacterium]|nr:RNA polymerase sigma factor [Anaerolineae bacterium]
MNVHRPAMTPDDEIRILRLAQHDRLLFAPIYEAYFERVYAYCLRRTGNVQEAEDLCSLVFIRALGGLAGYRGGMVAAWLFTIAHNTVVKHYRAKHPITALDDAVEIAVESDLNEVDEMEMWRTVAGLVKALPDEQRELLALTLDAGLNSQQVGEIMGKNATAVRVQLHRLLKQLREQYEKISGEPA